MSSSEYRFRAVCHPPKSSQNSNKFWPSFKGQDTNIAIRSGAVGALVDSFTRDSSELNSLEFCVFACGIYYDDIEYEGTVHAINRPITIGGITVDNGDYIYAYDDGVLAIPQDQWPSLRDAAMVALRKEFEVRYVVIMGEDLDKVIGRHGAF